MSDKKVVKHKKRADVIMITALSLAFVAIVVTVLVKVIKYDSFNPKDKTKIETRLLKKVDKELFLSGDKTFTYTFGTYEGALKNGMRTGTGKITYVDGSVYEGGYENNYPKGQGVFVEVDKDRYEGEFFSDGKMVGTAYYAEGDIYVGEFMNKKRNGTGEYTYASGAKYVGEFVEDKKSGQGKYSYAGGATYEGEFKEGEPCGQGRYTFITGNYIEGEFNGWKANGYYVYYEANGTKIKTVYYKAGVMK